MIYILHQVNCQNAFGTGFAGYIAKILPEAKQVYHDFCNEINGPVEWNLLGEYCTAQYDGFAIVHIFAQQYYGNSHKTGKCYTNYNALESALKQFRKNHPNDIAICPQYMGCGLAGGKWTIVNNILTKYNITPCDKIDLINRVFHKARG